RLPGGRALLRPLPAPGRPLRRRLHGRVTGLLLRGPGALPVLRRRRAHGRRRLRTVRRGPAHPALPAGARVAGRLRGNDPGLRPAPGHPVGRTDEFRGKCDRGRLPRGHRGATHPGRSAVPPLARNRPPVRRGLRLRGGPAAGALRARPAVGGRRRRLRRARHGRQAAADEHLLPGRRLLLPVLLARRRRPGPARRGRTGRAGHRLPRPRVRLRGGRRVPARPFGGAPPRGVTAPGEHRRAPAGHRHGLDRQRQPQPGGGRRSRLAPAPRDGGPAALGLPGHRALGRRRPRPDLLLRVPGGRLAVAAPGTAAQRRPPGAASAALGRRRLPPGLGRPAPAAPAQPGGPALRRLPHLLPAAVPVPPRRARRAGPARPDRGRSGRAPAGGRAVGGRTRPPARGDHGPHLLRLLSGALTWTAPRRSEEHTSELQSRENLVCRLLLRRTPISPLFPYTTLFRSAAVPVPPRRARRAGPARPDRGRSGRAPAGGRAVGGRTRPPARGDHGPHLLRLLSGALTWTAPR